MATKNGVRLLEYNARFGDPESLNVLSVLESDFGEICEAIVDERLHEIAVAFQPRATVCKYIVPSGYPTKPVVGGRIESVPAESNDLKVYPAAVDEAPDGSLVMSGSRALALVGIGDDLDAAYAVAEAAAAAVQQRGPVFYRKDIGTRALVDRRVAHMRELRGQSAASYSPISSPSALKSST
jgi:phosphoribosylamine---glycine ligase